jgi:anti-sigma B factor antagonist
MPTPANQVMVLVVDQTAFFRLRGRATAGESTGFKTAAEGLRSQGLIDFVIDLTECQSMDSTFIGVLTGLSRRLRREGGPAGKVELVNTTPQVRRQLDDLFVLDQFTLTECQLMPGVAYTQVQAGTTNKAELSRLMLDAHQTLMDLNTANIPKFKQVAEFLEQDLRKLGG